MSINLKPHRHQEPNLPGDDKVPLREINLRCAATPTCQTAQLIVFNSAMKWSCRVWLWEELKQLVDRFIANNLSEESTSERKLLSGTTDSD